MDKADGYEPSILGSTPCSPTIIKKKGKIPCSQTGSVNVKKNENRNALRNSVLFAYLNDRMDFLIFNNHTVILLSGPYYLTEKEIV